MLIRHEEPEMQKHVPPGLNAANEEVSMSY